MLRGREQSRQGRPGRLQGSRAVLCRHPWGPGQTLTVKLYFKKALLVFLWGTSQTHSISTKFHALVGHQEQVCST